jgi:hypothetical protein
MPQGLILGFRRPIPACDDKGRIVQSVAHGIRERIVFCVDPSELPFGR